MTEPVLAKTAPGDRREALRLLVQAARPERRHLVIGSSWLAVAAGLDALGPLLGKWLIDEHLVPRVGPMSTMISLLLGAWIAGMLASGLRYLQLIRLAGLAMRSVQRIRESVYAHVMSLPIACRRQQCMAVECLCVCAIPNDSSPACQRRAAGCRY